MRFSFLVCIIGLISCAESKKKPSYITLDYKNDSIFVMAKTTQVVPTTLKVEHITSKKTTFRNFQRPDSIVILKFNNQEIDSLKIFQNYNFSLFYGDSSLKKYDTLYNYNLPFSKGKRYKILQGNNGGYSHSKPTSKYAIDFKMNVGQEVCAIRNGYVVSTKSDSDERGTSKKYLNKANKIFVYHKDGTFTQYAHFKLNGVLVKAGDSIKKGQLIGYSGNTGYSSEPHLHFVLYKPTTNGLVSIPFILDSIPSERYVKGKFAVHN